MWQLKKILTKERIHKMWIFSKKKIQKHRTDILSMIEIIYLSTNPIDSPSIRSHSQNIYNQIKNKQLSIKQYNQIFVILEQIKKIKNNDTLLSSALGEIDNIIVDKKHKTPKIQRSLIQNESIISEKTAEIQTLSKQINNENTNIHNALKNNDKYLWLQATAKKKTILRRLNLIQKDIERIMGKTSTLELSNQVSESNRVTDILNQQETDLTDIAITLDKVKNSDESIKEEQYELNNMIDNVTGDETSFELAREHFLAYENNEDESQTKDIRETSVENKV